MDYLRNLGSAAVSSLVQKSGLTLPFSLGSRVPSFNSKSVWALHEGTKRDDGSPISVFVFDANEPGKRALLPLAKNALRKLRTVRHPDVLKFVDVVETDTLIYIMTEPVRPLSSAIKDWSSKGAQEREDWLIWGLHRISVALAFVNDSCASTHGNIRVDSVFIAASGEWRLGGFEVLSSPKDEAAVLYTMGSLLPDASMYAAPEIKRGSSLKESPIAAADAYALGLLIHFAFNPDHPLPPTAAQAPAHPPPTAASLGAVPMTLFPAFKRLLNPNPKARMTPQQFLDFGIAETAGEGSGFFARNRLVKVCAGLDNFSLGSEVEKNVLLRTLKESASSFPSEFVSYKVLPSLLSSLEFGGASAASVLPLVLQLGKNVAPSDYGSIILVHLVRLFASPDRGTRMALLDHLSEYAEHLDKKTVVEKVWPHLQTGFSDTVAIIREATIKSISLLSDKFNERIMNNDLLRHLAKMQADPEASIRTNTCILIGRLGPTLGYNTKRKVLVPAFTRALKDPFVHARVAGLMAFMATVECFDVDEISAKVIPNMAFTMIDKEKLVRDQAFKAMELFIKKLEVHAATMPETAAPEQDLFPPGFPGAMSAADSGPNTLVNSAAGAAGALAGWAISSLGRQLAAADLQSTMTSVVSQGMERSNSAPPPLSGSSVPGAFPSNNGLSGGVPSRPTLQSSLGATVSTPDAIPTLSSGSGSSKAKGMQLGASKVPTSLSASFAADWAQEAAAEADAAQGNPWGNDDLMDVNADQDDWSAFETAPVPSESAANDWEARSVSPSVVITPQPTPSRVQPVHLHTRPSTTTFRSRTPSDSGRDLAAQPATPTTSLSTAGMTKEEKAAEMARRKEERKQRIAALKEHKKNAAGPKA